MGTVTQLENSKDQKSRRKLHYNTHLLISGDFWARIIPLRPHGSLTSKTCGQVELIRYFLPSQSRVYPNSSTAGISRLRLSWDRPIHREMPTFHLCQLPAIWDRENQHPQSRNQSSGNKSSCVKLLHFQIKYNIIIQIPCLLREILVFT